MKQRLFAPRLLLRYGAVLCFGIFLGTLGESLRNDSTRGLSVGSTWTPQTENETQTDSSLADVDLGGTSTERTAELRTDTKSAGEPTDDLPGVVGFVTRITVDQAREVLQITREPFFARSEEASAVRQKLWDEYKRATVTGASLICIPDEMEIDALECIDHRWMVGTSEVRIALRLWGPADEEDRAAKSVVECVLWVDGIVRAIGHLANTMPELCKETVFQSIAVFVQGRVLVASACVRSDGEWRLSTINGNLDTTATWRITTDDYFEADETGEIGDAAMGEERGESGVRDGGQSGSHDGDEGHGLMRTRGEV
jgi:hypothetical protein